ncbi:MAG: universal stress protein [Anaerolineae bacterium]|jgi:nucleotide-binding universal stress UspA family protein
MDILICVACVTTDAAQLAFGKILGSIDSAGTVTLLHVVPRGGDRTEAQRRLAEARETLEDESVEMLIREGDPAGEILAQIEEGNHDLAILGPNEAPGLRRHILGSVTTRIVRNAPCSVLVAQQARSSLARILICSGGGDIARIVTEAGARLAGAVGAQATLLHIVVPVASMYTGLDEIEESLSELLRTDTPIARNLREGAEILEQHGVSAELKLRYGVVADEIVGESLEGDYDLIMLGAKKGLVRFKRLMLGAMLKQILEKSTRSILVARQVLTF